MERSPSIRDGAGDHMESDIQLVRIGQFLGKWWIHLGKGVAPILQRCQQARSGREDIGGNRRLSGMQGEPTAHLSGHIAIDGNFPEDVLAPRNEAILAFVPFGSAASLSATSAPVRASPSIVTVMALW
jgi:hypothetical protein